MAEADSPSVSEPIGLGVVPTLHVPAVTQLKLVVVKLKVADPAGSIATPISPTICVSDVPPVPEWQLPTLNTDDV